MFPSIVGSTSVYLLPGDPVTNVRLPRMFNAVFERCGIDAVMVPVQVAKRDLAVFVKAAFLAKNVRGMAIAPPHKPLLVDLLDGCGLFGRVAGSVNVVRRIANGELEGDLFDGEGLLGALDHCNIPFRGKRVLILGAGVSAAAIGVALAEGGTVNGAEHIAFHDIVAGKAAGVAAQLDAFFDATTVAVDSSDPAGYDLVVNATALGLKPDDPLPVDVARMEPHAALFDILLRNQPTPLVRAARARPPCPGRLRDAGAADAALLRVLRPRRRRPCAAPRCRFPARADLPPAMADEIRHPLRYHSASVA